MVFINHEIRTKLSTFGFPTSSVNVATHDITARLQEEGENPVVSRKISKQKFGSYIFILAFISFISRSFLQRTTGLLYHALQTPLLNSLCSYNSPIVL